MKILLYGMAESGLSTLFNQFKLLPDSVPLLSQQQSSSVVGKTHQQSENTSSSSNNNIGSTHQYSPTSPYTESNVTTPTKPNSTIDIQVEVESDENLSNTTPSPPSSNKPQAPSQALKPTRRPSISPLLFTPPSKTNTVSSLTNVEELFNSSSPNANINIKFLKRRKQAFNEHFLKSLPNLFLSQLLISFKTLVHQTEKNGYLFVSEETLQQFLENRIEVEKILQNHNNNSQSTSSNNITLNLGNNNLLAPPNNNNGFSSHSSGSSTSPSPSTCVTTTLLVPDTSGFSVSAKALIAKINNGHSESSKLMSQQQHHNSNLLHNIKTESKYKAVRNDLEKILKEQQQEFIVPLTKKEKNKTFTRQRSLSETILLSQIKKLKQKRDEEDYSQLLPPPTAATASAHVGGGNNTLSNNDDTNNDVLSTNTTMSSEDDQSTFTNRNLPPNYCEHCQRMAEAKLKSNTTGKSTSYIYVNWKVEQTLEIVERIKQITDIQQLYSVRRRSIFLKDCMSLWENHIGIQHTFHSYSIFKVQDGTNVFTSLPAIMKWILKKYLLQLPTKYFDFENLSTVEAELGEDIATSSDPIPPEMCILLNSNYNTSNINSVASARDYKFKFEFPSNLEDVQLKNSESSNCLISVTGSSQNGQDKSSPLVGTSTTNSGCLDSSFTAPTDSINYSKSDSELAHPINTSIYASISKHRASTVMNKNVISAIRPILLEEAKNEDKEEKKTSLISPRRLLSFFKSTESVSNQEKPPEKKKSFVKIKKEDTTHSVFSIITMGGISPRVAFLKKEWIMCCYASNMVLFVVNLCDYFKTILVKSEFSDQLMEKNRISYSLEKFEQSVNSKYFAELPIVLCFTFVDVFEEAQNCYPIETKKSEIESIVQKLNPASYGQKQTENLPLNVNLKMGQIKRKPWHDACEFIIQQYIHLATSEQRRQQIRESFVVLNCIDSRTTSKVLITDILFNDNLISSANDLQTDENEKEKEKINDGYKSDRSHYRRAGMDKDSGKTDYTQYYLRRCKNTTSSTTTKEQPSKIGKQRKSVNRKGGEKLKQEIKKKRLSWTTNGSIKLKKAEETLVVLDEFATEEEDGEEVQTARRRRKNSYNCLVQ